VLGVGLLASGWVASILFAPWLPVPVASMLYVFGGRICHQIAERSFFLDGAQLPICARCLGIHAGAAVGLLLLRRRSCAPGALWNPAFVSRVLLPVLLLNLLTLEGSSNALRAGVGAMLGLAVALAIRQALRSSPRDTHEGQQKRIDTIDEECPLPRRPPSALPEPHI
jgi:uncharacterized membrane protein